VKDSIFNEASTRKINELQLQYVTEKKNAQIKVLSQQAQIQSLQISHQRVLLSGSVALGLLLLLLLYVFFRQQKLKNDQKTTQLEQKTLLLQMNPHFIFNALTAIQMVVYQDNSAQAGKYISRFSKLMRLILENSRQEYISLQKEIQTLEYYFQLQQLRFAHTFDYQIYVDPQIDTTLVAIPPMFAQPLIENSMEHGLLHRHEQGQVHVRYLRQGDQILMEVEDNGVGRSQAAKQQRPETHTSLATQITQERLAILNRTQRRKVTLSIVDILGADQVIVGTKATFAIPYQTLL
jgi:LytS/YehU family sensor histidine kinase